MIADSGQDVSIFEDLGYVQANDEEGDVLFISFACNDVLKTSWLVATFFLFVACSILFGIFTPPPRGRMVDLMVDLSCAFSCDVCRDIGMDRS